MLRLLIITSVVLCASAVRADWLLDPAASSVTFASVKNGSVVEPHLFRTLTGRVAEDGAASVEISLDSVDTLIPIRDERLRDMLFDTKQFPTASFRAKVDLNYLQTGSVGTTSEALLEGELAIHGVTVSTRVPVKISRLSKDRVQVLPVRPMILSAASFGMSEGVEALRAIAGLQSIGPSVPVSFLLVFQHSGTN